MSETVWTILAAAAATFIARYGGYALLSRFAKLPPAIETALSAVPAAVLASLVAPAAYHGGIPELGALAAVTAMILLGWDGTVTFFGSALVLILLRHLMG